MLGKLGFRTNWKKSGAVSRLWHVRGELDGYMGIVEAEVVWKWK
jgi:hypothetical protein